MHDKPLPVRGDIIFVRSPHKGTPFSIFAQRLIDPDAASAPRAFGHVAIVVTDMLLLEAMPGKKPLFEKQSPTLGLCDIVEIGDWSGSELRGGVRLKPIADLIIPIMEAQADFAVLRAPAEDEASLSLLEPTHPFLLDLIGSKYSVDDLKAQADAHLPPRLANIVKSKFNPTSSPLDLATRMELDEAFIERARERFPTLDLPAAARSFYCSQLVIAILEHMNALPQGVVSDLTTPTGLYPLLIGRGWRDVSGPYAVAPEDDRYLGWGRSNIQASYAHAVAMIEMKYTLRALDLEVDVYEAAFAQVKRQCDEVLKKLDRHDGKDEQD